MTRVEYQHSFILEVLKTVSQNSNLRYSHFHKNPIHNYSNNLPVIQVLPVSISYDTEVDLFQLLMWYGISLTTYRLLKLHYVFYQMIERDPFLQIFFDSPTVRLWNTIEQYTHIPSDTHVIDAYSLAAPVDIGPQVEVYVPEGNQMGFSNPAILTGLFVTIIAISGFTIFVTRRRKV